MGQLVDGVWKDEWYDTQRTGGAFMRTETQFRRRDLPFVPGRYHLYVSLACPWASRAVIFRQLKKLEDAVAITVVDPYMGKDGWTYGEHKLYALYLRADPRYSGRVTVPVLWDNDERTIANNESSDIIRIFNGWSQEGGDLYPEPLRAQIDEINAFVYDNVNNGVYKCGFATAQDKYDAAFDALFDALDSLEQRLSRSRYLVGDTITEADWRLFTTLIRFDAVYVGHFKCNKRRIADYPALSRYLHALYALVPETVSFTHIKEHYYRSHPTINPTGIVPKGPALDF